MWPLKTSKMIRAACSGVLFLACTAWTCGRIMCRMNLCNYDAFSSCKHNRDNDRSACFLRTLIYACTSLSNSPSKEAYHESWQQSSSQSAVESAKITCMGMLNHWKRHIDHTGMSYVQLTDQMTAMVDIWEQCSRVRCGRPQYHDHILWLCPLLLVMSLLCCSYVKIALITLSSQSCCGCVLNTSFGVLQ